jgi:hypothetical protein
MPFDTATILLAHHVLVEQLIMPRPNAECRHVEQQWERTKPTKNERHTLEQYYRPWKNLTDLWFAKAMSIYELAKNVSTTPKQLWQQSRQDLELLLVGFEMIAWWPAKCAREHGWMQIWLGDDVQAVKEIVDRVVKLEAEVKVGGYARL